MRPALLCVALFAASSAAAQVSPLAEGGARTLALGGAGVALDGDVWGMANPAGWAVLTRPGTALFASQAYGMEELRLLAAGAALPTRHGVLTLTGRTYGFEAFREDLFGAGIGRSLRLSPTRTLDFGLAVRRTAVRIPDFPGRTATGLSAGLRVEALPDLTLGAHVLNLNRPALSAHDPLHRRLDVGVAYRPDPRALLLLAASQDPRYPISPRAGIELAPAPALRLRAGVADAPRRLAAGVGFAVDGLRADVAVDRHETLGWTPAFEIGLQW